VLRNRGKTINKYINIDAITTNNGKSNFRNYATNLEQASDDTAKKGEIKNWIKTSKHKIRITNV